MRKWKCIMSWFFSWLKTCATWNFLISNKRCGKVRLRQIYLNKRVSFLLFLSSVSSPAYSAFFFILPVRLKKSVMNFCSSWQMGSISLSTSRIVSEKRVLSAADKSIMNDPKAQILLYKRILENISLFLRNQKPTRSDRRHRSWSSHSFAFVDAERRSEFFSFFRQTKGALWQILYTSANFWDTLDRPRKFLWGAKTKSTRAFQSLVLFCLPLFHLVLKSLSAVSIWSIKNLKALFREFPKLPYFSSINASYRLCVSCNKTHERCLIVNPKPHDQRTIRH